MRSSLFLLSFLLPLSTPILSSLFAKKKTISLSDQTATLRGQGPPVLFSTGLFGTMPDSIYTTFLETLTKNLTIITTSGAMDTDVVTEVADCIGADTVGFLSHSSLDTSILENERVERCVLMDPVFFPSLSLFPLRVGKAEQTTNTPTLVLKAETTYEDPSFVIPPFQLEVEGPVLTIEMKGGHADILDEEWIKMANAIGIRSSQYSESKPFSDWSSSFDGKDKERNQYRTNVAKQATSFLTSGLYIPGPTPPIDVEEE